jgi:hypothetical protein
VRKGEKRHRYEVRLAGVECALERHEHVSIATIRTKLVQRLERGVAPGRRTFRRGELGNRAGDPLTGLLGHEHDTCRCERGDGRRGSFRFHVLDEHTLQIRVRSWFAGRARSVGREDRSQGRFDHLRVIARFRKVGETLGVGMPREKDLRGLPSFAAQGRGT